MITVADYIAVKNNFLKIYPSKYENDQPYPFCKGINKR